MASYGTDNGFTTWLTEQGYTLPGSAPSKAVLRARGSAYVDGYERFWTGQRTGGANQELAWPRTHARLNCITVIPDDVIPPAVVNAAYRAAWLDAETPGVLVGTVPAAGARVKRQKMDVMEREFFDDGKAAVGSGPTFIDSLIDGMLSAFICDAKAGAFLWSLGGC